MQRSRFVAVGLAFLSVFTLSAELGAQARQEWVESARPVSDAVDLLVKECRCVISYEDPRWDKADLEDATDRVSTTKDAPLRIYVPKKTGFVFSYERPEKVDRPEDMAAAVTSVVDWHRNAGHRSDFKVQSTSDGVYVFPMKGSALDVRMSIAAQEGRTSDMLALFLADLKKVSGTGLTLGVVPWDHLSTTKAQISARNEPAREVLARLLSSAGRKVYWRLYYDYLLGYVLNLGMSDPPRCEGAVAVGTVCNSGDTDKAVLLQPGRQ